MMNENEAHCEHGSALYKLLDEFWSWWSFTKFHSLVGITATDNTPGKQMNSKKERLLGFLDLDAFRDGGLWSLSPTGALFVLEGLLAVFREDSPLNIYNKEAPRLSSLFPSFMPLP